MTDEQISRLLAEHLGMIEGPYDVPASGRNVEPRSVMREIKIPNFVTDPAMRDLLQAKLLEEGWKVVMMSKLSSNEFCLDLRRMGKQAYASGTREHIWPMAFIRAHNLGE